MCTALALWIAIMFGDPMTCLLGPLTHFHHRHHIAHHASHLNCEAEGVWYECQRPRDAE